MTDEAVNQILARLDVIAGKLQIGAGVLWAALLKQAAVDAAFDGVVVLLLGLALVWFGRQQARFKEWYEDNTYDRVFAYALGHAAALAVFGFMLMHLYAGITATFNPEYAALQMIIQLGK